jgi:hypothetical protein
MPDKLFYIHWSNDVYGMVWQLMVGVSEFELWSCTKVLSSSCSILF